MKTISFFILFVINLGFSNIGNTQQEGITYTYEQTVDENSSSEYYVSPGSYGFEFYSWFNQDYGWTHTFPNYQLENMNIISAQLIIVGWDVDSEPHHGTSGEYDGIWVDEEMLNPGLLQGTNNTWSTTEFDLPISTFTDDGVLDVFLDIDMNHTSRTWATTLNYSQLRIVYTVIENSPPSPPTLVQSTPLNAHSSEDLVVDITGPGLPDPDGDPVEYNYRWYVDVGQGFAVDDEFAGKEDHQTNRVSASQTEVGEIWTVDVTAEDNNSAISEKVSMTFPEIHEDLDQDGIEDNLDLYPTNPNMANIRYYPSASSWNTLAFEDTWPSKGDFDLNDFVMNYRIEEYINGSNQVVEIRYLARLKARGGVLSRGFAIEIDNTNFQNISELSATIDSVNHRVFYEDGTDKLVLNLIKDVKTILPGNETTPYYNTTEGDDRPVKDLVVSIKFTNPLELNYDTPPFNPFIYDTQTRGHETHLIHSPPTGRHNPQFFKQDDDDSQPQLGKYYHTVNGLPWGLNLSGDWEHPKEGINIDTAYPEILDWAQSQGATHTNWYLNPSLDKIW